jgi:hypothetical protein
MGFILFEIQRRPTTDNEVVAKLSMKPTTALDGSPFDPEGHTIPPTPSQVQVAARNSGGCRPGSRHVARHKIDTRHSSLLATTRTERPGIERVSGQVDPSGIDW